MGSKWTKELCHKEALKYSKRKAFSNGSRTAYLQSKKLGIFEEVCSHMDVVDKKPLDYWTENMCLEEALKYKNRTDFRLNNQKIYRVSKKLGILDKICSHMEEHFKPFNYWTKELCHKEALKYKTKKEFREKSRNIHNISYKNKWIDDICSHMKPLGNLHKRLVYTYIFDDNCVYIGLTYNIEDRNYKHLHDKKSPIYKHILKTKLLPKLSYTDYMYITDAQKLEISKIEEYKNNNYIVLNKAKGGNIGGNNKIWNYEKCKEVALKYNTISSFQRNNCAAYRNIKKNGWENTLYTHMKKKKNIERKPKGYYNYEKCKKECSKYTKSELRLNHPKFYDACLRNKWLDIFYPKEK